MTNNLECLGYLVVYINTENVILELIFINVSRWHTYHAVISYLQIIL